MFEGPTSRVSCPRCGLAIRLHAGHLTLDRCPKCFAHDGVLVEINDDGPSRPALTRAPSGFQRRPGRAPKFAHLMITTEHDADVVVLALYGNLDMASEPCL